MSAQMKLKTATALLAATALTACATIPSSGPTGKQIENGSAAANSNLKIRVVDVSDVSALPENAQLLRRERLAQLAPPPTDLVGPGDTLDVVIYEAGVSLFANSGGAGADAGAGALDAGVKSQRLPPMRVNDNGSIAVPYVGNIQVAGHSTSEISAIIRNGLRGMSQNPQVMVSLRDSLTNSIIVSGEVARPGRLPLQTNRETLTDIIALAGGYKGSAKDIKLRLLRGGEPADVRLNDLVDSPELDVRAYPGDRIAVINDPRTFAVLGASGRVDQIPFSKPEISLAEAMANAGGVNPNFGDPAAIFVFRFVKNENGEDVPTVYHFNMTLTKSYFLCQKFSMQNGDVLYFGNASSNQPSKVLQLVSQLFTPIMTITSAVQTVQNSTR